MPNFYNESYMKGKFNFTINNYIATSYTAGTKYESCIAEGYGNGQLNSLARSNASIYGNKEDLYDRLRRHAYQGKKGK